MSKHLHVTLSVKRVRALNDVQLAAAVLGLMRSNFEVRHKFNGLQSYTFNDDNFLIHVDGFPINRFLGDVEIVMAENAQYEREHGELRRANEHFAHEHVRLSQRIAEHEATIKDQVRRLDNQSDSIGHYQEREERFEQQRTSDAVAIEVIARQKGNAEEIIADLRAERTNLLNRIESQRKTITDFQQKQPTFAHLSAEVERLLAERTALAADNDRLTDAVVKVTDQRDAALGRNAELVAASESLQHSFKLADRALSARNESIAAMDRLKEVREQEHKGEKEVLIATIARLEKSNENLSRNVTHYALAAGKVQEALEDSGRKQVVVRLIVNHDGSVTVQTDGNLSIDGNVECKGALAA
jgi:chromosome segregation ATPase